MGTGLEQEQHAKGGSAAQTTQAGIPLEILHIEATATPNKPVTPLSAANLSGRGPGLIPPQPPTKVTKPSDFDSRTEIPIVAPLNPQYEYPVGYLTPCCWKGGNRPESRVDEIQIPSNPLDPNYFTGHLVRVLGPFSHEAVTTLQFKAPGEASDNLLSWTLLEPISVPEGSRALLLLLPAPENSLTPLRGRVYQVTLPQGVWKIENTIIEEAK